VQIKENRTYHNEFDNKQVRWHNKSTSQNTHLQKEPKKNVEWKFKLKTMCIVMQKGNIKTHNVILSLG
jgi:hypothetical protein